MLRRMLLGSGVLASLLYIGIDVLAAVFHGEYHSFTSRAVSELMAKGAPTEALVDPLFLLYGALMIAFGAGVWLSGRKRRVHLTGALLIAYAVLGLPGPVFFEMNVRGTAPMQADLSHIVLTAVLVLLMLGVVVSGSKIRGPWFHLYSYVTLFWIILFGVLTAFAVRGIETGEPTPFLGVVERLCIGAYLLWVAALAVSLLRAPRTVDVTPMELSRRDAPPSAVPAR